jgi:glucan phosphorylase
VDTLQSTGHWLWGQDDQHPPTREASAPEAFDFDEFSSGDFVGAVHQKIIAESLTRVLYSDDSTEGGRSLRFAQEYFLVTCSLADIMARFRRRGNERQALPEKVAIQLNDTHPAIAVAELMRILLDQAGRLGRRPGISPRARWRIPITPSYTRRWRSGLCSCLNCWCPDTWKSSMRSTKVGELYVRPEAWARKAILHIGHSGKFSSDRTIAEYAAEIWRVKPCPVR